MNFKELYDRFVPVKMLEVKGSTINTYRLTWKYLEPKIGTTDISKFDRQQAKYLLATMIEDGLGPKSARDRMCFVKQLLMYAAKELEISIKPIDWQLKYPKSPGRAVQNFTESEMLRIVKAVTKEVESGTHTALPILVAVLSGLRIGEIVGLKWKDIEYSRNILNVRRNVVKTYDPETGTDKMMIGTPKTASGYRDVPLLPTLKRTLKTVGGLHPDPEYYVVGNSSNPKGHHAVRDTYSRFLRRNNLPSVNFHGLRHTFATLLVESGGDIKTISVILGHADVSTTLNLYVHPSLDAKRKVVNKAFKKLRKLSKTEDDKRF
ncbi:MAG: site-specific integrase [Muribaculaceae bacterium]|nr:site-specific integrase [Muribaculaceae bacterium]